MSLYNTTLNVVSLFAAEKARKTIREGDRNGMTMDIGANMYQWQYY